MEKRREMVVRKRQVEEFLKHFSNAHSWDHVCDLALGGGFGHSCIRSVLWRSAAGLLPLSSTWEEISRTWGAALHSVREEYVKLKEQVVVNPHDVSGIVGDPLSDQPDNPWTTFHKDKELLDEIKKDVDRLFPTGAGDFFTQEDIAQTLQQVLFVWCKLHPDTSYRQGMHELAGPILFCFYNDASDSSSSREGIQLQLTGRELEAQQVLKSVLDINFLEHDVFWVFQRIMQDMKPLYLVSQDGRMTRKELDKAKRALQMRNRNEQLGVEKGKQGGEKEKNVTPIIEMCNEIQHSILKQVDGALYNHLEELQIEPQLYALRWLRLLFSREFHIEHTMLLWDALFVDAFDLRSRASRGGEVSVDAAKLSLDAKDPDCGVDFLTKGLPATAAFIAVGMLTYIRRDLLNDDTNVVLMKLMKFPQVDDAHAFIHLAFNLRNSLSKSKTKTHVPVPSPAPKQPKQQQQQPSQADRDKKKESSSTEQMFKRAPSSREESEDDVRWHVLGSPHDSVSTQDSAWTGQRNKETSRSTETKEIRKSREGSPSPIGMFFKEIGEKIEHIFDKDMDDKDKASSLEKLSNEAVKLKTQNENLQIVQSRMGQRVSDLVQQMEHLLSTCPPQDASAGELLKLTAQMKQVRDVLLGRIQESDCFPMSNDPLSL